MVTQTDIKWFKLQFGTAIESATDGTLFDLDMLTAIACQETGYIWSILRKTGLSPEQISALCVGDTLDDTGGRVAFPKNQKQLLEEPKGQEMFGIARKGLTEMAAYVPGYGGAVANPKKFCHGFGVFQRDLQFFKVDPNYFLQRKYEHFDQTLNQCLIELQRGVKKLKFEDKTHLTDLEFAHVAIAYNTGGFKPAKGLKQGHFNGKKYYGEEIFDFIKLSRGVSLGQGGEKDLGRFVVVARGGLVLRKGPDRAFDTITTLPAGTQLTVVSLDGPQGDWARVDLEDDGLVDGHVFFAFLKPADD